MSRTKQSANTTHRKRLARRYAEVTGVGYQQALDKVTAAAEAGVLPTPLDPAGMDTALAVLAASPFAQGGQPHTVTAGARSEVMECVYCTHPMTYNSEQLVWVTADMDVTAVVAAAAADLDLHELLGCDPALRTGGLVAFLTAGWHALGFLAQAARDAGDSDHGAVARVRDDLRTLASEGPFTDLSLRQWATDVHRVADNVAAWAADAHEHLSVTAGIIADQFAAVLADHYNDALKVSSDDVDALVEVYDPNIAGPSHHLPAPHWLRAAFFLETSDDVQRRAASRVAPTTTERSAAVRSREEKRLLDLLDLRDGRIHIAGIVECRTALALAEHGKVVIETPDAITDEGGSGWIRTTAPQPATDTAGNPKTWFVAHDGNPVPRCTGTSWRGNNRQGKRPYGPGGFNRCVKVDGHSPEDGGNDPMHVDEWGNVFRKTPKFKVVRNISNAEMAEVAREAGMAVGTRGQFQSKADAIKPNTLWMTTDREMVKVSTIYSAEDRITGQVVYPVPPRTTVRSYSLVEVSQWKQPSTAQVRKYERAWGFED